MGVSSRFIAQGKDVNLKEEFKTTLKGGPTAGLNDERSQALCTTFINRQFENLKEVIFHFK